MPGRTRIGTVLIAATAILLPPAAQAAAPEPVCDRAEFRVAVDVGHTRDSPGARSARGSWEYDFNLTLGNAIEQALREAGFGKTVLLVTDGRAQQSLFRRVAAANALPAHLFVSIHHDSVPEIFLLNWDYEGSARRFSDAYKGHSIFISNDNSERAASLRFGHLLGMQLKARDLQYTAQYTESLLGSRRRVLVDAKAGVYRYDQLIVLRHTRMPAVLLEAGSIINREEELLSASPERQKLIAAAVAGAVEEFCAIRLPKNERLKSEREAQAKRGPKPIVRVDAAPPAPRP